MIMKKCLVVLSGGQDSTTCLYWALQEFDVVHAVTFDYGQRHRLEIEAACKVAGMAGVMSHEVISVPNCLVSTSPLLSDNQLEQYTNAEEMEKIIGNRRELTFVPMRNVLFLTVAINRAFALGITDLVTGICQEDNANYSDCTEQFRASYQVMANTALGEKDFVIHAPLMYKSKAETVQLAYELPGCWEALAYSHTSYDGKYPPTDRNHANILRADGFEKANLPDPLVLRAVKEGLMDLPMTTNYRGIQMEMLFDGAN